MSDDAKKVALITGSASGIGRACARRFAAAGYNLVLTDISTEGLEAVAGECAASGAEAVTLCGDITATDTVEICAALALDRFGRLDAAANCAGIAGPHLPAADFTEEIWQAVIGINLTALWRSLKFEVQAMRQAGNGGAIVNISSTAGLKGYAMNAAYCASKHGVIGMSRCAAMDYAGEGIRINVVCPGLTRTALVEGVISEHPERIARIAASHPIGRIGEPEEIADAVFWLCSDKSSFVVGTVVTADGGHLAG